MTSYDILKILEVIGQLGLPIVLIFFVWKYYPNIELKQAVERYNVINSLTHKYVLHFSNLNYTQQTDEQKQTMADDHYKWILREGGQITIQELEKWGLDKDLCNRIQKMYHEERVKQLVAIQKQNR